MVVYLKYYLPGKMEKYYAIVHQIVGSFILVLFTSFWDRKLIYLNFDQISVLKPTKSAI